MSVIYEPGIHLCDSPESYEARRAHALMLMRRAEDRRLKSLRHPIHGLDISGGGKKLLGALLLVTASVALGLVFAWLTEHSF